MIRHSAWPARSRHALARFCLWPAPPPKSPVSTTRSEEGGAWLDRDPRQGLLVMMQGKTGLCEVGVGAAPLTPPGRSSLAKLDQARKAHQGPPLSPHHRKRQRRRTRPDERQGDRRLGNSAAPAHLSEGERAAKNLRPFSAGRPCPSAESMSVYVQNQLGHAAEMTRKYRRRRDQFRMSLTNASGL